MAANVLVAFASKHGATKGLAYVLGATLHDCGHRAHVLPAAVVRGVVDFDAVIVGSALYHSQWLWDAQRFVRRSKGQLRGRPIWLFSSGPTGGTREGDRIVAACCGLHTAAPSSLLPALRGLDVRGHATFGGKVAARQQGLFDQWMPAGDWRDFRKVEEWGRRIAAEVHPVRELRRA